VFLIPPTRCFLKARAVSGDPVGDGRHPIELTPARLLVASTDLPHSWAEQRSFLGIAGI
jgi:hypothetical protein